MPSLDDLPPELYSAILEAVPVISLQQTTLSLLRAIPRAPVPQYHLFSRICLNDDKRVIQLYRRLRGTREDAQWVKELRLEAWTLDAEVVINLLAILSNLTRLTLFIGPNFTPEHLEEILEKPRVGLRYLAFRFKPYVQRATYYQFLKGAYFDSTLTCLSNWPVSTLPTLSIVQDPLDEAIAQRHRFAQPLVFFSLEGFITLSQAPYLSKLTSLRLRVPSRSIAPFICLLPRAFPALRVLDMSTCNVKINEMESILVKFDGLKHLILDRCSLIQRGEDAEWAALGKACALAGVQRAKECEKEVKTAVERHRSILLKRMNVESAETQVQPEHRENVIPMGPRARAGRKGVANATISLRRSPTRTNIPNAVSDITPPSSSNLPPVKIRILPPPPVLLSLCTTVLHSGGTGHANAPPTDPTKQALMRAEFARGWREGLALLAATYKRLHASKSNGIRVMQLSGFSDESLPPSNDINTLADDPFSRLRHLTDVRVDDPLFRLFETETPGEEYPRFLCPTLCFAGSVGAEGHFDGCGHEIARAIWLDE